MLTVDEMWTRVKEMHPCASIGYGGSGILLQTKNASWCYPLRTSVFSDHVRVMEECIRTAYDELTC